MDYESLKILEYETSVCDLPDSPSDAGYTADEIKAVFDARTDNEVKDRHNRTVDALKTHSEDGDAHGLDEIKLIQQGLEEGLMNTGTIAQDVHMRHHDHVQAANPHKITAQMLGLGRVDNTHDMEKPVSSAVAAAIEAAKNQVFAYVEESILGGAW